MGIIANAKRKILELFLKRLLKDAQEGDYGDMIKAILDFVNGKKTLIGILIIELPELADSLAKIVAEAGGSAEAVVKVVGYVVAALGLAHKLLKDEAR